MKDKESRKLQHKRNRNSFRKTIKKRLFSNFGNLTQKRSDSLLEDCNVMIKGTGSSFSSSLHRTANELAQCLAEAAFQYGEKIWMQLVPAEASAIVLSDIL